MQVKEGQRLKVDRFAALLLVVILVPLYWQWNHNDFPCHVGQVELISISKEIISQLPSMHVESLTVTEQGLVLRGTRI
jgi:hypothetical protein